MDKLYGYPVTGGGHDTPFGVIYAWTGDIFGEVYVTEAVTDEPDEIDQKESNYKVICVLRELCAQERRIIICRVNQKERLRDFRRGAVAAYTIAEILDMFPRTINEIQDRILLSMARASPRYGSEIDKLNVYDFFARDQSEMFFLMDLLKAKGSISVKVMTSAGGPVKYSDLKIAENGWLRIEQLNRGIDSRQVFIAMWFDPSMDPAYAALGKACSAVGLKAFRIDKKEYNNEISGEILQEIRQSHFVIADVTRQRQGVYYEAGFASGIGKTVIWSCNSDDLKNVHFDTRQYNHVVWDTPEMLTLRMIDRIRGTVLTK